MEWLAPATSIQDETARRDLVDADRRVLAIDDDFIAVSGVADDDFPDVVRTTLDASH